MPAFQALTDNDNATLVFCWSIAKQYCTTFKSFCVFELKPGLFFNVVEQGQTAPRNERMEAKLQFIDQMKVYTLDDRFTAAYQNIITGFLLQGFNRFIQGFFGQFGAVILVFCWLRISRSVVKQYRATFKSFCVCELKPGPIFNIFKQRQTAPRNDRMEAKLQFIDQMKV